MSVNIRYPNITAGTEKEQLAQIKSYLLQLVNQLNFALPAAGAVNGAAQEPSVHEVQGGEISYYELRSLIIQQMQELDRRFEQLSSHMKSEYVSDDELPKAIAKALSEAKESGEFDGPPGKDGKDGKDAITETGTVDGWTYTKWSNGIYEMFGEFHITTSAPGAVIGSMYSSEELTLPTPFAISSAIVHGSASDYFLVTNAGATTEKDESHISFSLLRPDTFDAETEITVMLRVTGTLNQGGTDNGN